LCDDWFGLPDLVEEEVTLEGQAPFMAGKDPPEVDELETTSYAAEHLLYIIYVLMQTSRGKFFILPLCHIPNSRSHRQNINLCPNASVC